ncbi:MAG: COG4315 family predicted lipoprotein, partial [Acidimicrobiales bacterium]
MKSSVLRSPTRFRPRILGAATAVGLALGTGALLSAGPADAGATANVQLVRHGGLGKILETNSKMAVYIFTADPANRPTCTGGCASAWPPLTVGKGVHPRGGPEVRGLGTVSVGSKLQVTWNKHPLYTYALDTGPGVVNGNGIKEGSGTWLVASAKNVTHEDTM